MTDYGVNGDPEKETVQYGVVLLGNTVLLWMPVYKINVDYPLICDGVYKGHCRPRR